MDARTKIAAKSTLLQRERKFLRKEESANIHQISRVFALSMERYQKHPRADSQPFTSLIHHHPPPTPTPTPTPTYINLTVASPSTNQVGAIGHGGPLGWRPSGKVTTAS
jgi:hypothetical protein